MWTTILYVLLYLLLWIITSCMWFIHSCIEYKKYRERNYDPPSFDRWYVLDNRSEWVILGGLIWPISVLVVLVLLITPIITKRIRKYFKI